MLVAACAAVPVQKRLLPLLARPASASACPPAPRSCPSFPKSRMCPSVCLVRAMRKLGGTCPFLLLLDDLPAPPGATSRCRPRPPPRSPRRMVAARSCCRYRRCRRGWSHTPTTHRGPAIAGGFARSTRRAGCRTRTASCCCGRYPVFEVVFLDIDILIVANVDALLREAPFAAAAALPYATSLFNSGVMVLSPTWRPQPRCSRCPRRRVRARTARRRQHQSRRAFAVHSRPRNRSPERPVDPQPPLQGALATTPVRLQCRPQGACG